jgi:hypothetical protein
MTTKVSIEIYKFTTCVEVEGYGTAKFNNHRLDLVPEFILIELKPLNGGAANLLKYMEKVFAKWPVISRIDGLYRIPRQEEGDDKEEEPNIGLWISGCLMIICLICALIGNLRIISGICSGLAALILGHSMDRLRQKKRQEFYRPIITDIA